MTEAQQLPTPPAEAFRQGYEPHVRWGYQCLTCNDEWYVASRVMAENGAAIHNEQHTPFPTRPSQKRN